MEKTAQLAGFVAAHAILCVSKGKSLTMPLLVVEKEDGSTQFIEVKGKSSQEAVRKAESLMKKPVMGALRAVIAFEAFLNLPPGKTDAIFPHACCYQPDALSSWNARRMQYSQAFPASQPGVFRASICRHTARKRSASEGCDS